MGLISFWVFVVSSCGFNGFHSCARNTLSGYEADTVTNVLSLLGFACSSVFFMLQVRKNGQPIKFWIVHLIFLIIFATDQILLNTDHLRYDVLPYTIYRIIFFVTWIVLLAIPMYYWYYIRHQEDRQTKELYAKGSKYLYRGNLALSKIGIFIACISGISLLGGFGMLIDGDTEFKTSFFIVLGSVAGILLGIIIYKICKTHTYAMEKKCSGCGNVVPDGSYRGDHCPHCGAYWSH